MYLFIEFYTAGKDFKAISAELVFTAGQSAGSVLCTNIAFLDDTVVEDTEHFTIQLSPSSNDSGVVIIGTFPSVTSVNITIFEDNNDCRFINYFLIFVS